MVIDYVEDEKIVKVKLSAERSVSVQVDIPALPAPRAIRSLRVAREVDGDREREQDVK